MPEAEEVNTIRFSANVLTYSEMRQQEQLQRIVGSFGFVALRPDEVTPPPQKARPASRPMDMSPPAPEGAPTEVVDSPVEVPDVAGCEVLPQGSSSSSNDPVGGGVGGLFGSMFRLPDWCKRQKVSPPATQEPPPEAPPVDPAANIVPSPVDPPADVGGGVGGFVFGEQPPPADVVPGSPVAYGSQPPADE